jgi:hypothetical protein
MKYARVKDILHAYQNGKIENLKKYFAQEDLVVEENTWSKTIQELINENKTASVMAEIELIIEKFNFYNYVSEEKRSRTSVDSVDGK